MSKAQRAQGYLDHVDEACDRLLSRQAELVRLASNQDKDMPTIAVETAEVEACATSMVRGVEDLLVVTRSLKEAWVLGQVREPIAASKTDSQKKEDLKKLLETICKNEP